MINRKDLRAIIKQIESQKSTISEARDELLGIHSELEDIIDSSSTAVDSLDDTIRVLSDLL